MFWLSFCFQECKENSVECVPVFWYCDGKVDCPEGSDELECSCGDVDMVECLTQWNSKMCLPQSWICVGHPDCFSHNLTLCQKEAEVSVNQKMMWCPGDDKFALTPACGDSKNCEQTTSHCSGAVKCHGVCSLFLW